MRMIRTMKRQTATRPVTVQAVALGWYHTNIVQASLTDPTWLPRPRTNFLHTHISQTRPLSLKAAATEQQSPQPQLPDTGGHHRHPRRC